MSIRKDLLDYIMVLALIFISGNIAFTSKAFLFIVFIISTILFFYRKIKFDISFLYFALVLMVILILQTLKFNFFPIETYIALYMRILVVYFLIKSVPKFIDKFIKIMYIIALLSIVFYTLSLSIPHLNDFCINNLTVVTTGSAIDQPRHSIMGLYTLVPLAIDKNAGPFWEMGAFGGYLIITLMFSYLKEHTMLTKINIVLIIAILTTQSSTTYIALMAWLFFIFYSRTKDLLTKIVMVTLILGISYTAFVSLDFLGEKIEEQFNTAKELIDAPNLEDANTQRFITMLKDWKDLQGHELIGRGPNAKTRYTSMYEFREVVDIRTVGSTDMIVRYGIPFFILLIFLMYQSYCAYSKAVVKDGNYICFGMVIVTLILLMSEVYFSYPLFWMLILLQHVYKVETIEPIVKNEQSGTLYTLKD